MLASLLCDVQEVGRILLLNSSVLHRKEPCRGSAQIQAHYRQACYAGLWSAGSQKQDDQDGMTQGAIHLLAPSVEVQMLSGACSGRGSCEEAHLQGLGARDTVAFNGF